MEGLRSSGAVESGEDLAYRKLPRIFEGTGRITGEIDVFGDVSFPDQWRLVVEPSKYVEGRQHAGPRQVLEFDGSQRTFEVLDLPLGAYRVAAEAEGVDCLAQEVLLFMIKDRGPTAGKTEARLQMRFHGVRGCSGSVVDASGDPAQDLAVTLIPKLSSGSLLDASADDPRIQTTVTNGSGSWAFARVQSGNYLLVLGKRDRPLIKAQTLQVPSAALGQPPVQFESTIPETLTLEVTVIDVMGRGLPGTRLRGIGPSPIDVEVDSVGVARASYLLPGSYRLMANHDSLGLSGEDRFVLEKAPELQTFQLICRP